MKDTNLLLRFARIMVFLVCLCLPCSSNSQSEIDWWNNDTLIVKGYGLAPDDAGSLENARSLARRAAVVNGYRALAQKAKEIPITAKKNIGSQILEDKAIEIKLNAIIKGAQIISEEFDDDGNCVVELSVPIYGVENSLAEIVFKPVDKENFPSPNSAEGAAGNYTGLIIDCGDLDLNPVLAPVIRNTDNQTIYAYNYLDRDKVISKGMVSYVKKETVTFDEIILVKVTGVKNYAAQIYDKMSGNAPILLNISANGKDTSRAGDNPLVIKAKNLSDANSCPVISPEDADKILAENKVSHFLDEGSVVFTGYRVGGLRV